MSFRSILDNFINSSSIYGSYSITLDFFRRHTIKLILNLFSSISKLSNIKPSLNGDVVFIFDKQIDFSNLLSSDFFVILIIASFLIALYLFLKHTETKYKKKIASHELNKNSKHKSELKELESILKNQNPRDSLFKLNNLMKNFFKDFLELNHNLTNVEIIEKLKERKYEYLSEFFKKSYNYFYSNQRIDPKKVSSNINEFEKILKKYKVKEKPEEEIEKAVEKKDKEDKALEEKQKK